MVSTPDCRQLLSQIRAKTGWTWEAIAAEIGADKFQVSRWTNGHGVPTLYVHVASIIEVHRRVRAGRK